MLIKRISIEEYIDVFSFNNDCIEIDNRQTEVLSVSNRIDDHVKQNIKVEDSQTNG